MKLRKVVLPDMSEREFTKQVLQLAFLCGWRTIHLRPARTLHGWRTAVAGDGVGFPDVVLLRGTVLIAAELKSAAGRLTPEQQAWLDAFEAVGARTAVWRPSDWPEIERVLGRGA